MAFDQPTRNRLAKFVGDARSLLTDEFTRQLQNEYGLDPKTGDVTELDRLDHLVDSRREGTRVFYRIADPYVLRICDAVCDSLGAETRADKKKQTVVARARKSRAGGDR